MTTLETVIRVAFVIINSIAFCTVCIILSKWLRRIEDKTDELKEAVYTDIARRKLETIVAALNFETRQRALEKEKNADNTQTADTEPVSDVALPAKVAMAEIPCYGVQSGMRRYGG